MKEFEKRFLGVLDKVKPVKGGYMACCPAHDDKNPSLFVRFNRDANTVFFKCMAGCKQQDVSDIIFSIIPPEELIIVPDDYELNWRDEYGYEPDYKYEYRNEENQLTHYVVRKDKSDGSKQIRPFSPQQDKYDHIVWKKKAPRDPRPLYGLEFLKPDPEKSILIVEGEKAADAARAIKDCDDYIVMTWQGGASAIKKADWNPLKGRNVKIWPDNDKPGIKAAWGILKTLKDIGIENVDIVDIPEDFPKKWDLADPLPEDHSITTLLKAEGLKNLPAEMEQSASIEHRGYAMTDYGNALRFYDQHKNQICYCYDLKVWFVWDGKRWIRDNTGEPIRRAKQTSKSI